MMKIIINQIYNIMNYKKKVYKYNFKMILIH